MKKFIIDIETNGIENPDTIWCVVVEDLDTGQVWEFTEKEDFLDFYHTLRLCLEVPNLYRFIGHNIIDFDIPVLRRLWDLNIEDGKLIDTLILSRLYSPKLESGHSLETWGNKLGYPKTPFTDFTQYSKEMLAYCRQDVVVTRELYKYLINKVGAYKQAIQLEHQIAVELRKAQERGFYFNTSEAIRLLVDLEKHREKLDEIIHTEYPPYETGKRKKKLVYFNPNSPKQVIDKLWDAGWKPKEKTEGHKANTDKEKVERYQRYGWKINEANLATLPDDAPIAVKSILKRTIYETRIRKLNEWLELVAEDGAIHGRITGLGAWTHRMTHSNPNMANISAKKSIKFHSDELKAIVEDLGEKMRSLWIARPNHVLVGTDAEGIQLRVLAHYMEDEEFTKAVTEGNKDDGTDPHSLNCARIGTGTRDNAKTFIYAFLLGAGDGKIGEIYNTSRKKGRDLKQEFIESTPGLKFLKSQRIPTEAFAGFTTGFDGRRIYCNSEHLMMAVYLQAGEAIIMKKALVLALNKIREESIPAYLINVVHDEMIFETTIEYSERVREITEWSIEEAGRLLKLKCPMKGQGNVGRNWMEVH